MTFASAGRRALERAGAAGAAYADVRFEDARTERIEVRNGAVAALADETSIGYGLRALVDGAWGFAASADLSDAGLDASRRTCGCDRACRCGGCNRTACRDPQDAYVDSYATPGANAIRRACRWASASHCCSMQKGRCTCDPTDCGRARVDGLVAHRQRILQHDRFAHRADDLSNRQRNGGDRRRRRRRARRARIPGDVGLYQSRRLGSRRARTTARERAAHRRRSRRSCCARRSVRSGAFDIILGGSQMSLQIHESCGHAAELDRVMGWEANFSGMSFLESTSSASLQYGSPTRHDRNRQYDAARPGDGRHTTTKARRACASDIIRDGVLVGYEMSRDTARAIGRASNACVRAESWEHVPMIRMCNLNLLPGERRRSSTCSTTSTTACTWKRTARGRSTTGA